MRITIDKINLRDPFYIKAIIVYLTKLIENAGDYFDQNPMVSGLKFTVEKP